MTAKTARVYTLDKLKEKCQKALDNPILVEIVRTTPINNDNKISLGLVYREAERFVHEETKDLQKTKELAVATRFLAMLRRDFAEEFEKLVTQKELKQEEVKTQTLKKLFQEIEFKFPLKKSCGIELITRENRYGNNATVEHSVRFISATSNDYFGPRTAGLTFCREILDALVETANPPGDTYLMNILSLLLEEKFGLKVKVCGNCKYFKLEKKYIHYGDITTANQCGGIPDAHMLTAWCKTIDNSDKLALQTEFDSCGHWTPKEISAEKKEN